MPLDEVSVLFGINDLSVAIKDFLAHYLCEPQTRTVGGVRPDVTTLVTGNTEQRVTQTHNCTATSS